MRLVERPVGHLVGEPAADIAPRPSAASSGSGRRSRPARLAFACSHSRIASPGGFCPSSSRLTMWAPRAWRQPVSTALCSPKLRACSMSVIGTFASRIKLAARRRWSGRRCRRSRARSRARRRCPATRCRRTTVGDRLGALVERNDERQRECGHGGAGEPAAVSISGRWSLVVSSSVATAAFLRFSAQGAGTPRVQGSRFPDHGNQRLLRGQLFAMVSMPCSALHESDARSITRRTDR